MLRGGVRGRLFLEVDIGSGAARVLPTMELLLRVAILGLRCHGHGRLGQVVAAMQGNIW